MAHALSYCWRFAATAIGWIGFGVFALLGEALMPLTTLPYRKGLPRQKAARRQIARSWRYFLRYLQLTQVIDIDFRGRELLGKPGQLILVNHPSLLDILILLSNVPEANCIVKQKLLDNPFTKYMIKSAGFIPNNNDEQTLQAAATALQGGETLIIFPEGTRTKRDKGIHFNRAAVTIGMQAAGEIRPVAIAMFPQGFKREDPWYKIPPETFHYQVKVLPALDFTAVNGSRPRPVDAKNLNNKLLLILREESQYGLKNTD